MTKSHPERASWFAILLWGVRKLPLVVIACALVLGLALPFLTAAESTYQAEALVVARQLELDPSALPPYGQAVFTSDAMIERVAADAGLSRDGEGFIADRLDVVAAEDSIVLGVFARADEPLSAARLADLAAAAFVIELNKGGVGVGTFAVQSPAQVPTELTTEGSSRALSAVIGVIAGTLLGFGLIALFAAVRRPVLQASDAESIVGRPVIGVVVIPTTRTGHVPDPHEVPGLVVMARALLPMIDKSVVLASAQQTAAVRQRLLVLLALALSPFRNIFVSASPRVQAALAEKLGTAGAEGSERASGPGLELVDSVAPVDTLEVPEWALPVILVIRYGEPTARLRNTAADYLDEEILGIVMVDERRGLMRKRASPNAARTTLTGAIPEGTARADQADVTPAGLALREGAGPSR